MAISDPNTQNDLITVNVTLDAIAVGQAGFSTTLLIANDVTLNSLRVATYSSLAEVSAAETAGFVTSAVTAAATAYFGQATHPATLKVGRRVSASESYVEALDAIKAVDADFYGIILEDRDPALTLVLAADVEADEEYLIIAQDNDVDWKTTGIPSAWSAAAAYERLVIVYHNDDTADDDAAYASNRLAWDPDVISAGWSCNLDTGTTITAVTATEKGFLRANNANFALPFGPTALRWMDPGNNVSGRGVYEIVSADWFSARLIERIATTVAALAARGQKLPVSVGGQSILLKDIEALLAQGVTAQHFAAGQTVAVAETISAADTTARRLRFTVTAQLLASARIFTFNVNLSQSAVVS